MQAELYVLASSPCFPMDQVLSVDMLASAEPHKVGQAYRAVQHGAV